MRKKWTAIFVTLLILVAVYGVALLYVSFEKKETPVAANGVLDLAAWSFLEDGVVPLSGEWEFYPNRLLALEDFLTSTPSAGTIHVPSTWSSRMTSIGMATYRLRVNIENTERMYGMKTASIQISNRLIVNGQTIGASGKPDEQWDYYAVNKPYVSYFILKPGWNEILVQVANYELHGGGGINEAMFLGTAGQISGLRDRALTYDWVNVTAFLIMGLYFIGLYAQRKHDRSLIVFGFMCISIALFMSAQGERVLLDVFDNMPFWLYLRLQMLAALAVGFGFLLYVYTSLRSFCSKSLVYGALLAGTVMGALFLVLATEMPEWLSLPLRQMTTLYVLFSFLYATYIFVLAALHKVEGSWYLILAAIALNVLMLKQNMNIYLDVKVDILGPFEPFLVLLMLALLMSLRFTNAFRKIEDLSGQLLKADKMKDDFLARTSHEFKSPLHGVMSISKSMLEDAAHPPTETQREKIELITGITGRLSQLVYDILDFSQLKQGELKITQAPTDVRSAVEVQIRIYTYLCIERNIRLLNQVPANLPLALADEIRLSQIVGNLLDNAVKHTKNGSIVVTAEERDGMIEVSVHDTGEGVESKVLPSIFEPFMSKDDSNRQGFGLGLYIVKQLVELQHGTISAISKKGEGSTFTFTLPIAHTGIKAQSVRKVGQITPKQAQYSFSTPYDSNRQGKHTVLIVDDQFVNLKVLLDALHTLEYRVIAVKNGYEALEQIDGPNRIDLVILDLMMPGISGYEVCQEIRKRHSLLELPVLMVTAAIHSQDKLAAFQAGANDYLPKPFDLNELKARVGNLLAMKESFRRAVNLEVAFLQSQIKPHFLYNVMNSIIASSYKDVERARKLIADLADYLRGSFRFSNAEELIGFAEEFDLIRTYIEIERARFKDRIRFEYDIPESANGLRLPPLLLQPLVENAIRHGIGDRIEGGTVSFTAYEEDGYWRFVVADDGVGIEPERLKSLLDRAGTDESQGVGLRNINKRLKYEYGIALELDSEPGKGTKVTVRIPALSI